MFKKFAPWMALIAAAGCSTGESDPEYRMKLESANWAYEKGKYVEAKNQYEQALEKCKQGYLAIVGLANTCRELGFADYADAENNLIAKKSDMVKKSFEKANLKHQSAQYYYLKAIEMRPKDMLAHRDLGIMYYRRGTSPFNFPYLLGDGVNRKRERDEGVRYLKMVVEKAPDDYWGHRYLGLAYFISDNTAQGREHLALFMDYVLAVRERTVKYAPAQTEQEKEAKQQRLNNFTRELNEVLGLIMAYREKLKDDLKRAEQGPDAADLKKMIADLDQQIGSAEKMSSMYLGVPNVVVTLRYHLDALRTVRQINTLASDPTIRKKLVEGFKYEILQVEALLEKYKDLESLRSAEHPPDKN